MCSALARPKQRWSFGELTSIPLIAAAHAEAIVVGHPFSDGNKRTGFWLRLCFLDSTALLLKLPTQQLFKKFSNWLVDCWLGLN
ncbi:Fic family protein [Synechococcus lacustris Tous-12m]